METSKTNTAPRNKHGAASHARRSTVHRSATAPLPIRAQRPLLVPLGAALIARDRLVNAARPYSTPTGATRELSRQLRRFERRGARSRDAIQHQLEHRRDQVSRILRRQRHRTATPAGSTSAPRSLRREHTDGLGIRP